MKSTFFLLFLSMLWGCAAPNQTVLYMEKYKKRIEPGNKMVTAGANFTIEQAPDLHYIRKEYYYDTGQKIIETTYADPRAIIADGPAKEWYDNGLKWSEGQYTKGKKTGVWKEYGRDGKSLSRGEYLNGQKEGLWVSLDSLGNKSAEAQYRAGKMDGTPKYFNPDGTEDLERFEKVAKAGVGEVDAVQIPPSFPCDEKFMAAGKQCGEKSLMQFLSSNIRYPAQARENGVSGKALVEFVVDKDGSVTRVTVLRGVSNDIKAECERILKIMPKWNPGMSGDKPVKVLFTLPIGFRLE